MHAVFSWPCNSLPLSFDYVAVETKYAVDFLYPIAITVMFNQSTYSVIESERAAQATLVLSNPSSSAFTVQVTNTDVSATGKY